MKKFEQMKSLLKVMETEYTDSVMTKMYISGITADFSRLFELGWKTLKNYLQDSGFIEAKTGSPKDIIKLAYRQGIIDDGQFWLDMLADRNDDTHHYSESAARAYAARIHREYLPFMAAFADKLSPFIPEEPGVLEEIPDDFLKVQVESGMDYDEFVAMIKQENNFKTDLEMFDQWSSVKAKYEEKLIMQENDGF